MLVRNCADVLPLMQDAGNDFVHSHAMLHLGKNKRAIAAHFFGVAFHHFQIGADGLGEVGFVDDQQIGLSDSGAAFARNFVAAGDIDDLDGVVRQFAAETGGQIIAAGFDQQNVGMKFTMQFFEGEQVGGNIFANGGVRAAARFDGANTFRLERLMFGKKLAVFFCKNVVGDGSDVDCFAQPFAKLEHQRGFTTADGSADADGERALIKIAVNRHFAIVKMARAVGMRMAVAILGMNVKEQCHIQL